MASPWPAQTLCDRTDKLVHSPLTRTHISVQLRYSHHVCLTPPNYAKLLSLNYFLILLITLACACFPWTRGVKCKLLIRMVQGIEVRLGEPKRIPLKSGAWVYPGAFFLAIFARIPLKNGPLPEFCRNENMRTRRSSTFWRNSHGLYTTAHPCEPFSTTTGACCMILNKAATSQLETLGYNCDFT